MLKKIIENHPEVTFLKADGFDAAVIGISEDFNSPVRLIYSVKKCLDIIVKEGMSSDDAIEHFTFNVSGGFVGEKTPVWCWDNY